MSEIESIIATVENQAAGKESGCLSMRSERLLVAEITALRIQIQGVREQCARVHEPSCSCLEPCDDYFCWPSPCHKKAAAVIRALPLPESDTVEKVNRLVEAAKVFSMAVYDENGPLKTELVALKELSDALSALQSKGFGGCNG